MGLQLVNKDRYGELLSVLPDDPEHMYRISLLRTGKGQVYAGSGSDRTDMIFVGSGKIPEVWISGSPASRELADWLRSFSAEAEFMADAEFRNLLEANLAIGDSDIVDLYELPEGLKGPESMPAGRVRRLDRGDVPALDRIPEEAMDFFNDWNDFDEVVRDTLVYGVVDSGEVRSFAIALAQTETLVDIGVWTLSSERRKGLSYACSGVLIKEIIRRGKQPVWGHLGRNEASKRLGIKLGFRKVSEIFWCTTGEPVEF